MKLGTVCLRLRASVSAPALCYTWALGSCYPLLTMWFVGSMPEGSYSDRFWCDFYVSVSRDFVFSVLIRVFIDVHSQFCPVYCPSDYGIMTHRLPLRLWVHDSEIAPQIMRSCPTDCPSDYEFMAHRLSLGLWDYVPQIVPRIVRSCPTDCPSIMRCTVFSDDFCFRALLLRFLGLGFYYLLALWRLSFWFYGICVCLVDV